MGFVERGKNPGELGDRGGGVYREVRSPHAGRDEQVGDDEARLAEGGEYGLAGV